MLVQFNLDLGPSNISNDIGVECNVTGVESLYYAPDYADYKCVQHQICK